MTTDLSPATVTICGAANMGNQLCDIRIYGHRNPDELVKLRTSLENAGFSIKKAGSDVDARIWTLAVDPSELIDGTHITKLHLAITNADMEVLA